jgi:hypothetical protein
MKTTKRLATGQILSTAMLGFMAVSLIFPTKTNASPGTQGYNAVYCQSGVCGSAAYIDATAFPVPPDYDPCAQINAALTAAVTNGLVAAIIDARGLAPGSCASNPFNAIGIPSTVLLPAGTITLTTVPWTLPSGTKIIGEGVGITTLAASSSVTTLIQMGSSSVCSGSCTGVGVQDLRLDLSNAGPNFIGIDNEDAGDLSYVQRVAIVGAPSNSTGLKIGGQYAQNSGPYSDIELSGQGSSGAVCVQIMQYATGIKIRGLDCAGTGSAAIVLDGSNDSIKDVYVSSAYTDGILVGADNNVSNDVLLNVNGGKTNTVHVCGPNGGSGACSGKSYTVTDLSLLGISSGGATNSITDEATATTLSDTQVEMYILGESVTVNPSPTTKAYARFTTSPSTATWGVYTSAPMGNCTSSSPNTKGALFSNTNGNHGSNGDAFFVCNGQSWLGVY